MTATNICSDFGGSGVVPPPPELCVLQNESPLFNPTLGQFFLFFTPLGEKKRGGRTLHRRIESRPSCYQHNAFEEKERKKKSHEWIWLRTFLGNL